MRLTSTRWSCRRLPAAQAARSAQPERTRRRAVISGAEGFGRQRPDPGEQEAADHRQAFIHINGEIRIVVALDREGACSGRGEQEGDEAKNERPNQQERQREHQHEHREIVDLGHHREQKDPGDQLGRGAPDHHHPEERGWPVLGAEEAKKQQATAAMATKLAPPGHPLAIQIRLAVRVASAAEAVENSSRP